MADPADIFYTFDDENQPDGVTGAKPTSQTPPKKAKTQKQLLIELASDTDLFHTPEQVAWATIPVEDHSENWLVESKGYRGWLQQRYYTKRKDAPSNSALQEVVELLAARARFDGPMRRVFTRVAEHGGNIYIDLANDRWEAVEISAHGWAVIRNPPMRFRRAAGMLALPFPERRGNISLLRKHINVDTADQHAWILVCSWLTAALRPSGPYPVLVLQGPQGSAKSTTSRILRSLVDPFFAPLRSPPRDEQDLMIAASNSWLLSYDNLSGIPPWLSDCLCRLATGGGIGKRKLYTDQEEILIDVQRPIIVNGIDQLTERPDLADRALVLNLPRIDDSRRRDNEALECEFKRDLPAIFGALLDASVVALRQLPSIHIERLPRMADFAKWATAAEVGFGFPAGAFMGAYKGNREEAIETVFETDSFAEALRKFAERVSDVQPWDGTCEELRRQIDCGVEESTRKSQSWPKNAKAVSKSLRRLSTTLREVGIEVKFVGKSSGGRRIVSIAKA